MLAERLSWRPLRHSPHPFVSSKPPGAEPDKPGTSPEPEPGTECSTQPCRHRVETEADVGERHDAGASLDVLATCDETPAFIASDVECQDLDVDVEDLCRAWQRDRVAEDREKCRGLLVDTVRVERDGLDTLTQGLTSHGLHATPGCGRATRRPDVGAPVHSWSYRSLKRARRSELIVGRMERDQFFARLGVLGEERVQKALWNLYWRGNAEVRRLIEAELQHGGPRPRRTEEPIDPVADEVRKFVELARSGAYLGRDRRVSPRERTRWRFTFQRLVKDSERSLRDEDLSPGAAAMELLHDLSQQARGYNYFRSEDPIEAARIVVSDEVALLWSQVLERHRLR